MGRLRHEESKEDGEDLEICGCDFEVEEGEATRDDELPAAFGGVRAFQTDDEQVIDGCDVDFNAVEPTSDWELPVSEGGVK